jgi:Rieske Fe-S protein
MTRREALKYFTYLLWLPFAWIIFKLDERQNKLKGERAILRVPAAIPDGISFYGTVIANKHEKRIQFLSSRCTHLGCTISKEEGGILVCPCHGSSFDKNGKNLSGPAVKPLENLRWQLEVATGDYLVHTKDI